MVGLRIIRSWAEAHFLLYGWLRCGNCGTSRGDFAYEPNVKHGHGGD
jgi:hypothetical protein